MNYPVSLADDLVLQIYERTTLGLLTADADEHDNFSLVDALARNRRITASNLLRAICVSDLNFFEAALARLGGIYLLNARTLIHDKGALRFKSLYEKCQLRETLFEAYRIALEVLRDTELERIDGDPGMIKRRMLERILAQLEDFVDKEGRTTLIFC